MENFNYGQSLKKANIAYLGASKQSAKLTYSFNNGYETYGIYLAPATLARDEQHPHLNVCPFSTNCREHCLNGSGHNKCATLHLNGINALSKIDQARVRKTHLFYDDRGLFMEIMLHELQRVKRHAERNGMEFAVRLNCTSDLSPELFSYKGKNILEMFPNVQFYDYTKVPNRLNLAKKYPNYYLVFSYDGTNWDVCENWLSRGGNVAVVFDMLDENNRQTLPQTWRGYNVIDGNLSDIRFVEPKGCIVGLHYHRVANDYKSGKYNPMPTTFIVR